MKKIYWSAQFKFGLSFDLAHALDTTNPGKYFAAITRQAAQWRQAVNKCLDERSVVRVLLAYPWAAQKEDEREEVTRQR